MKTTKRDPLHVFLDWLAFAIVVAMWMTAVYYWANFFAGWLPTHW